MASRLERGGQWPADVARLLDELPEWFGVPESNAHYVAEAGHLPTIAALDGERTDIWGPQDPCLLMVKPLDRA